MFNKILFVLPFFFHGVSSKFLQPIRYLSMKKDKSKMIKSIIPKSFDFGYSPKSDNQQKYVDALNRPKVKMTVVVGPAGTGKTLFACLKAIELLKNGEIHKVIITRPLVTVEEELGFLPGNIVKKMDPWTRPIFDLFLEHYSKSELDNLINNDMIEISPIAFMRGRTFKHAFIIADEMQNSTPNQMKMLTTRIGVNSKLVITGDLQQSDRTEDNNGLSDIMNKISIYNKNHPETEYQIINTIKLDSCDVERSELVKEIITIYDYKEVITTNTEGTKLTNKIKPIDFDSFYKRN